MPIIKYNGNIPYYVKPADIKSGDSFMMLGDEAELLKKIQSAIASNQSVQALLEKIPPDYRDFLLNCPVTYPGLFGVSLITPAHLAAYYGNVTALRELADWGSDFKATAILHYDTTPESRAIVFLAAINNHAKVIEYLRMNQHVKPKSEDLNELLHLSVRFGQTDTAEQLLSLGADINSLTPDGDTLLHAAMLFFLYGSYKFALGTPHTRHALVTNMENLFNLLLKNGVNTTLESTTLANALALDDAFVEEEYLLTTLFKDKAVSEMIQSLIAANWALNRQAKPVSPVTAHPPLEAPQPIPFVFFREQLNSTRTASKPPPLPAFRSASFP